jgi:hypothetical protein
MGLENVGESKRSQWKGSIQTKNEHMAEVDIWPKCIPNEGSADE